jgi:hypothetical protein
LQNITLGEQCLRCKRAQARKLQPAEVLSDAKSRVDVQVERWNGELKSQSLVNTAFVAGCPGLERVRGWTGKRSTPSSNGPGRVIWASAPGPVAPTAPQGAHAGTQGVRLKPTVVRRIGAGDLYSPKALLHHKPAGALDALAPSHAGRARAVRAVVASDIGVSRQTVERYMRFRDQVKVAAAGRARLQVVEG